MFERLPRGYALTDRGREFLNQVTELESRILPLADKAGDRSRPVVKISAGHWVASLLCARITELVESDLVALRFIAADDVLDINRREAVIGIRNRRPEQAGLAGRRTGRVQFASLHARDGDISTWARVMGTTPSARWLEAAIRDDPFIEVTYPRNALDLALAGAARVVLPTFIGRTEERLRQMSPPIAELEHEQWLVTHDDDRCLPEVRNTISRTHSVLQQVLRHE